MAHTIRKQRWQWEVCTLAAMVGQGQHLALEPHEIRRPALRASPQRLQVTPVDHTDPGQMLAAYTLQQAGWPMSLPGLGAPMVPRNWG